MIGHQVVLVYRLDSCCQCFPYLRLDITLDVTTHKPNNIRFILIAVSEERTIFFSVFNTQLAVLDQSAPDTYHTDIDTILVGKVDDIVQMVPIAINTLLVDILEVPTIYIRHLSIDVIGRYSVNDLYLYHVVASLPTALQIPLRLGPVESFR